MKRSVPAYVEAAILWLSEEEFPERAHLVERLLPAASRTAANRLGNAFLSRAAYAYRNIQPAFHIGQSVWSKHHEKQVVIDDVHWDRGNYYYRLKGIAMVWAEDGLKTQEDK